MRAAEFDAIERFCGRVGCASLFEWLALVPGGDPLAAKKVLQAQLDWAHRHLGAGPDRAVAAWLLEHQALVRMAILDAPAVYWAEVQRRQRVDGVEALDALIAGVLANGVLTSRGALAVRQRGAALGMPPAVVQRRLSRRLAEAGAQRAQEGDEELTGDSSWHDHYAVLGVEPEADGPQIEAAYRARYAEARLGRDAQRAAGVYDRLDRALRVLRDPDRRRAFDRDRGRLGPIGLVPPHRLVQRASGGAGLGEATQVGFVPSGPWTPPESTPTLPDRPLAQGLQHPHSVDEEASLEPPAAPPAPAGPSRFLEAFESTATAAVPQLRSGGGRSIFVLLASLVALVWGGLALAWGLGWVG